MTEPKRYEMNGTVRLGRRKFFFFLGKKCFVSEKNGGFPEKNVFFRKKMGFFLEKMFFFGKKCFFSEKNVIGLISVCQPNDNTVIVAR